MIGIDDDHVPRVLAGLHGTCEKENGPGREAFDSHSRLTGSIRNPLSIPFPWNYSGKAKYRNYIGEKAQNFTKTVLLSDGFPLYNPALTGA
jgi:hypothetical protein